MTLLPESASGTHRNLRAVETVTVPILSRRRFLDLFADEYRPGQHVTLIGPTQRGKTTLCHEMLDTVISHAKERPYAIVFAGKPAKRDPVMNRAARRLNLQRVHRWPPNIINRLKYKQKDARGWLLRPRHDMESPEHTDAIHYRQFRSAMIDAYKSDEPVIVVVDEGSHISRELKLAKYMDTILMRGAPVVSLWTLVQRGRYMSYMIYDQPEWFLVAYDPDVSNQKRYGDIGGIDPRTVFAMQNQLEMKRVKTGGTISQFLCIRRSGPEIFIVDTE